MGNASVFVGLGVLDLASGNASDHDGSTDHVGWTLLAFRAPRHYLSLATRSLWSMATLPTPEESARRILSIFALNNSRSDDVLVAEQANFAFRQAGGSAAEFQTGLEYAVQNGWLEIGENNTIKLTNAGCRNVKPDKNSN